MSGARCVERNVALLLATLIMSALIGLKNLVFPPS